MSFLLRCAVLFMLLISLPCPGGPDDGLGGLGSYADPSRIWGSGVEAVIEEAYRRCFRTYIIGERVMNIRMSFAMNENRNELTTDEWQFIGGGKANPDVLWPIIDRLLGSDDFLRYAESLQDGREKVVIFDIPNQKWSVSRDIFDIARMKAGSYRGLPHRPYVLHSGEEVSQDDVYNYLYCIGWTGMDCSGFVWYVLSYTAAKGGTDLGQALRRILRAPGVREPALYAGTAFYNLTSPELIPVDDRITNLRPADVMLFRSSDGGMGHSAVIQSIDRKKGVIRYLQCTDEAPSAERGVHESYIYFDPAHPEYSLKDSRLRWSQERSPTFPGEPALAYTNDGPRYRAYPEHGAGRVVRFRAMAPPIQRLNRSRQ